MALTVAAIAATIKITGTPNENAIYVHHSNVKIEVITSTDFVNILDSSTGHTVASAVYTDYASPAGASALLKADAIAALVTL